MKVFADRQYKLRHFVKTNHLKGIKTNDDLQKYYNKVGLEKFMKEHQNAMIAYSAGGDYDIDFLCESKMEELTLVGLFQSFFNKPKLLMKG